MNKREFMMLAKDYSEKEDISGWFVSEKLDGMRVFWDGGTSRGLDAREVPYANTAKDARFVERPIATGLWSRYGKVVHAPDWWLDGLPVGPTLDMELWMGRGTFQKMRSVCGSLDKGEGWRGVTGWVIDSPSWASVLADGEMTGTNWKGYLDRSMIGWVEGRTKIISERGVLSGCVLSTHAGFGQPAECFMQLKRLWDEMPKNAQARPMVWMPMNQTKLPDLLSDARTAVDDLLQVVAANGGEGLILRGPTSPWVPKRVPWVLKVKKLSDAEGTVIGFTWGRETTLGSKLLGKMGALVLTCHTGKRLELSGFTDEERRMEPGIDAKDREGYLRPGEPVETWHNPQFPIGSKVTYTYRDLSVDRVPKEARFLRTRKEGE